MHGLSSPNSKLGHPSINPWSPGPIFPATVSVVENADGKYREVSAHGEVWRVWHARPGYYSAVRVDESYDPVSLGKHADLYDAAAQLALGLLKAHEIERGMDSASLLSFRDEIVIIDECSSIDPAAIRSFNEAVAEMFGDGPAPVGAPSDIPVTPEEEEIPADYWVEKKALLASDYPAEEPPAAVSWLERRPARDCGVRS